MIIKVKAKPNSNESKLERISENEFIAHVKSPAEGNKANIELIKLISKKLNINYKNINIKNPLSKDKLIELITVKQ